MGANTYAYVDSGLIGDDGIRADFLYQPGTVSLVGASKILDDSVDPTFSQSKNRPSLAQTFTQTATGEKLTVVINHFKSKGSACEALGDPDAKDGQGNCNQTRVKAATAVKNWLASDPTGSGDSDFLVMGDFNAYAKEDPVAVFTTAGYAEVVSGYSFSFEGLWGSLDHAMASASLAPQVAGAAKWHINADEPYALDYNEEYKSASQKASLYDPGPFRASDHDPILVGLNLTTQVIPPKVNLHGLKVTRYGRGTVTATNGMDCGTTCEAQFVEGTTVTLTATPEPSWTFERWLGDCDANGAVAMTAAKTCTAVFGITPALEDAAPNNGDGNGDGVPDSQQPLVISVPDAETGAYITAVIENSACTLVGGFTAQESSQSPQDAEYGFPQGLLGVALQCPQTTLKVFWHGLTDATGLTIRRHGPTLPGDAATTGWYDQNLAQANPVVWSTASVAGQTVVTSQVRLIDGQTGDDTVADGLISALGGAARGVGSACFDQAHYAVAENGGSVAIPVTRVGTGAVTVNYTASGQNAVAGQDFTLDSLTAGQTAGTLSWTAPGTQRFTVNVTDNATEDGDKTVQLALQSTTHLAVGCPNGLDKTVLTIVDDEGTTPPPGSQYTLTVKSIGLGSVTSQPAGLQCAPGETCSHAFAANTRVTLTASAHPKWRFAKWLGDCSANGQVTLDQDRTCTAAHDITAALEDAGPNGGDGNGDGIPDSQQPNVITVPDAQSGQYLTTEIENSACLVISGYTRKASDFPVQDPGVTYPQGLVNVTMQCPRTDVTLYYHGLTSTDGLSLRRFGPTLPGQTQLAFWYAQAAGIEMAVMGGQPVVKLRFSVVDGEHGDDTGKDGMIVGSGGLALTPLPPVVSDGDVIPPSGPQPGQDGSKPADGLGPNATSGLVRDATPPLAGSPGGPTDVIAQDSPALFEGHAADATGSDQPGFRAGGFVQIQGRIAPAVEQRGQAAKLFTWAEYQVNGKAFWFQQDATDQWQPWDQDYQTLQPRRETDGLQDLEVLSVHQGDLDIPGVFQIYTGFQLAKEKEV